MKIISITLLWLSISFCQTSKQSFGALNPNIGMSAGAYANAGTDKLEVDGFFEIQFINGLYGDVWFSNLDMDSETSLELNSSLGWMKEMDSQKQYLRDKSQADHLAHHRKDTC